MSKSANHDDELNRRLSYSVFETSELPMSTDEEGCQYVRLLDYCCDPVASFALEQKMVMDHGFRYTWELESASFLNWGNATGDNRLHATALAADITMKMKAKKDHDAQEFHCLGCSSFGKDIDSIEKEFNDLVPELLDALHNIDNISPERAGELAKKAKRFSQMFSEKGLHLAEELAIIGEK